MSKFQRILLTRFRKRRGSGPPSEDCLQLGTHRSSEQNPSNEVERCLIDPTTSSQVELELTSLDGSFEVDLASNGSDYNDEGALPSPASGTARVDQIASTLPNSESSVVQVNPDAELGVFGPWNSEFTSTDDGGYSIHEECAEQFWTPEARNWTPSTRLVPPATADQVEASEKLAYPNRDQFREDDVEGKREEEEEDGEPDETGYETHIKVLDQQIAHLTEFRNGLDECQSRLAELQLPTGSDDEAVDNASLSPMDLRSASSSIETTVSPPLENGGAETDSADDDQLFPEFNRYTFTAGSDTLCAFPDGDLKHVYSVRRGIIQSKIDWMNYMLSSTCDLGRELVSDFTARCGGQFNIESKPWMGKLTFGNHYMPDVFGSERATTTVAFTFCEAKQTWIMADPKGLQPRNAIAFLFTPALALPGVHIMDLGRHSFRYVKVTRKSPDERGYAYFRIKVGRVRRRTWRTLLPDYPRFKPGDLTHAEPVFYGGVGEVIRVGAYIYGEHLWVFSKISVFGEITLIKASFLKEVMTGLRHVGSGAVSNVALKLGEELSPAMRNVVAIICCEKQTTIPATTGTDWSFIPNGSQSPEVGNLIVGESATAAQNLTAFRQTSQKRMVGGTKFTKNTRSPENVAIQKATYEALLNHANIGLFAGRGIPDDVLKETTRQAQDAIRCADNEVDAKSMRSTVGVKNENADRLPGKTRFYCVMNAAINSEARERDVLQSWAKGMLPSLHFGRRPDDLLIFGRSLAQIMNGQLPDEHTSTLDAESKVRERFDVDFTTHDRNLAPITARLRAAHDRGEPMAVEGLDMEFMDSSAYGTWDSTQDKGVPTIIDKILEGIVNGENNAECAGDCVYHLWLTLLHPGYRADLVSTLNKLHHSASNTKFSAVDFDGIQWTGFVDMSSMTVSGSLVTSIRNSIIAFLFAMRLTAQLCFADVDNIPIEEVYELEEFWTWVAWLVRVHGDDVVAVLPRTAKTNVVITEVARTFGLSVKREESTFKCTVTYPQDSHECGSLMPREPVYVLDYSFFFLGSMYARRDTEEVVVPNPTRLMNNLSLTPNTDYDSRMKYVTKMAAAIFLLRPQPGTASAEFLAKTIDELLSIARQTDWWKNDTAPNTTVESVLMNDYKLSVIYDVKPENLQKLTDDLLAQSGPGVKEIVNSLKPRADGSWPYLITKDDEALIRYCLEEFDGQIFFSDYIRNGWIPTQAAGFEAAEAKGHGVMVREMAADPAGIPGHNIPTEEIQVKKQSRSQIRTFFIPTARCIKDIEGFQRALRVYFRTLTWKGCQRGKVATMINVSEDNMITKTTNLPVWLLSIELTCKDRKHIFPIVENALATVYNQYLADMPADQDRTLMQAWLGLVHPPYSQEVFRKQEIKCFVSDQSFVNFAPADTMLLKEGIQVKDPAYVRKRDSVKNKPRKKGAKHPQSSKQKPKAKGSAKKRAQNGRSRVKKGTNGSSQPSAKKASTPASTGRGKSNEGNLRGGVMKSPDCTPHS